MPVANATEDSSSNLECGLSQQLFSELPNNSDSLEIGGVAYPTSNVELHRPTGKYISRVLIRIFNLFSRKGVIRIIGNACAPGLKFPVLKSGEGMNQFVGVSKKCPIVAANILGYEEFPQSVSVKGEPFMVLDLETDWRTFDDYLGAFSSKYRVRAKKALKETQGLKVAKISDSPANQWIAQCGNLLKQSLSTKTIAIGKNLPQLLLCYKQSLKDKFEVWGYYDGDQLIGFISCIRDNNKIFAMHLGIDKKDNAYPKLYSRMLLDMVKWAIENQVKRVNFGRTGSEIKSTLGAKPVQNSFVVFTRSNVLLFLFRIYAKYFQKKYSYTLRKPFKEDRLNEPLKV